MIDWTCKMKASGPSCGCTLGVSPDLAEQGRAGLETRQPVQSCRSSEWMGLLSHHGCGHVQWFLNKEVAPITHFNFVQGLKNPVASCTKKDSGTSGKYQGRQLDSTTISLGLIGQ